MRKKYDDCYCSVYGFFYFKIYNVTARLKRIPCHFDENGLTIILHYSFDNILFLAEIKLIDLIRNTGIAITSH